MAFSGDRFFFVISFSLASVYLLLLVDLSCVAFSIASSYLQQDIEVAARPAAGRAQQKGIGRQVTNSATLKAPFYSKFYIVEQHSVHIFGG